jgi:hypothetical protein
MSKKRTVALVNGIVRMKKYNASLTEHYEKIGLKVVEYQFPVAKLFCCHLHHTLEGKVKEIVAADVVHCQSSGFFPILPHMINNKIRKPLIMESPVLSSHTGTLYAATNKAKHYSDVKQNKLINWLLDTFAFTPAWTKQTLDTLKFAKDSGDALVLHSDEDGVSDVRGLEKSHLTHVWKNGKHARLFHPDTGNDFNVIAKYIEDYKK